MATPKCGPEAVEARVLSAHFLLHVPPWFLLANDLSEEGKGSSVLNPFHQFDITLFYQQLLFLSILTPHLFRLPCFRPGTTMDGLLVLLKK